MVYRNPSPKKILVGDIIVIAKEDKQYEDLIQCKFLVLEIDLKREDGRCIKPGQFNGKPIRHVSASSEDYWTRIDFVEVDKRTIDGKDIYFETSIAKTIERGLSNCDEIDFL